MLAKPCPVDSCGWYPVWTITQLPLVTAASALGLGQPQAVAMHALARVTLWRCLLHPALPLQMAIAMMVQLPLDRALPLALAPPRMVQPSTPIAGPDWTLGKEKGARGVPLD